MIELCALLISLLMTTSLDSSDAKPYQTEIEAVVNEIIALDQIDSEQDMAVLAIGAPEMLRFSKVSNMMEYNSLRLMYVAFGSSVVDFSTGKFQMKVSFIERLENEICQNEALHDFLYLTEYSSSQPEEIRQERLDRIQDTRQAMNYLQAFDQYMDLHFREVFVDYSETDKLKFKAAAYNLGFDKPIADVELHMVSRSFPFGIKSTATQLSYATFSSIIYQELKNRCYAN